MCNDNSSFWLFNLFSEATYFAYLCVYIFVYPFQLIVKSTRPLLSLTEKCFSSQAVLLTQRTMKRNRRIDFHNALNAYLKRKMKFSIFKCEFKTVWRRVYDQCSSISLFTSYICILYFFPLLFFCKASLSYQGDAYVFVLSTTKKIYYCNYTVYWLHTQHYRHVSPRLFGELPVNVLTWKIRANSSNNK